MTRVLGIDEAGRGCVIGPLVVAGVLVCEEDMEALSALGVRDSKQLSRAQRNALSSRIERLAHDLFCIEIAPEELEENLTEVELAAFAQIIRQSGADRVIVDLPVGPKAQKNFIRALLRRALPDQALSGLFACARQYGPGEAWLIAENSADARYPVVSAASIIAKVHRDRAIEKLREQYGDFGWGYPSEPKTRAFLKEHFARTGRFPQCARAKWRTLKEISELK